MPRKRAPIRAEGVAIDYHRVSTQEQVLSGLGLEHQRNTTDCCIDYRHWTKLRSFCDEGLSGKDLDARPGLRSAIETLTSGEASILVVAKLDRLTRNLPDLLDLMAKGNREGWRIVAVDLGLDMTTPMGEAMAAMAGVFAQLERRLISQRTKDALAIKRSQGVRLGRPPMDVPPVAGQRIAELRGMGVSFNAITGILNDEAVPTLSGGGRWHPPMVRKVALRGEAA